MLGGDVAEFASVDDWLARVDARDRTRVRLELTTCMAGLSPLFESEYRMADKDGDVRWFRAQGVGGTGRDVPASIHGSQQDVTERRALDEAARRADDRFRALVERCPDAVAVHRHGRFVYVNARMGELLGADPQALCDRLLLEVVHPDDFQAVVEEVQRLEGGGPPGSPRELRLLRGDRRPVLAEVSALRDDFDGAPAIFVVARDVSERRRILDQVVQNDRMATLGTLAAGVAHEINNPLSYLSGNLHMVAEGVGRMTRELAAARERLHEAVGPERASALSSAFPGLLDPASFASLLECIRDATDGAERVRAIVADLKHFARRDDRTKGPVDLRGVAERALKIAMHEIKHRARIVTELAQVPPVLGEEGRLSQVFINLIVNAAHAMDPERRASNEIRVSVAREDEEVVARVSDTGSGIDDETLGRLFQPFVTTKAPGKGSGLGLAICRHIVTDHGGSIHVESEPGKGSTFTVRLPALVDLPAAERVPEVERDEPVGDGRRARVLVIDDEPALVRAMERALSQEFDVVTASGGREAIELLGPDGRFDLVLCDVMMLERSGRDVHEWVRVHRPELAARMVFITGGVTNAAARAFLEDLDNLVVEKPFDFGNLRRVVRNLVRAHDGAVQHARPERRRAQRHPATGMYGVLKVRDVVHRVRVIDYSASGLRVSLEGGAGAAVAPGHPLVIVLNRTANYGVVQAEVRLVRTIPPPEGPHVCVEIASMNASSQAQYLSWIPAHA
jgi:PAS domain S-box-containing protein